MPNAAALAGSAGAADGGLDSIYGRIKNLRQNLNQNFMTPSGQASILTSSVGTNNGFSYSNTGGIGAAFG